MSTASGAQADPEALFRQAYERLVERQYRDAWRQFDRFIALYPDHVLLPEAYYYQAEAALGMGYQERALQLYESFVQRFPYHPFALEALLFLGQSALKADNYALALLYWRQVRARAGEAGLRAQAEFWIAEAYRRLGRLQEAEAAYQEVYRRHPRSEVALIALYTLAQLYLEQGRLEEAQQVLERIQRAYPEQATRPDFVLWLAELRARTGRLEELVADLVPRLDRLPFDLQARALFWIGTAYAKMRDPARALVYFERLRREHPRSPQARRAQYEMAWAYAEQGAYAQAAAAFAELAASGLDSLSEAAAYYAAAFWERAGRIEEARRAYGSLLERFSGGSWQDRALLEWGRLELRQNRPAEAIPILRRLLERHPNSPLLSEGLEWLGRAHLLLGEYTRAAEVLEVAASLGDVPLEMRHRARFLKAWTLLRGGFYRQALQECERIYQEAPSGPWAPEALFWAAEAQFQLGQAERAAELWGRFLSAFRDHPYSTAARYGRAWALFRAGRYVEAIPEFRAFLGAYRPPVGALIRYDDDARLRLADAHFALKQYAEAIAAYQAVIDRGGAGADYALFQQAMARYYGNSPQEAIRLLRLLRERYRSSAYADEAHYQIGWIYFRLGRYPEAIAEFERLRSQNPASPFAPQALYNIGDAYYNAGRLEEAVRAYEDFVRQYPQHPLVVEAISSAQYAYEALGRSEQGEALLERFAAQNPDNPLVEELRYRIGELRLQAGRYEEAIRALRRFIETARGTRRLPEAYYNLGFAYRQLGRLEEAIATWQRLVSDFPGADQRRDALRQLGELYLEQGRYRQAIGVYQLWEQAARTAEERLSALVGQAQAHLELGNAAQAEQLLRRALGRDGGDSLTVLRAELVMARALEAQGRLEEAERLYQKVANAGQADPGAEAQFRLGILYRRRGLLAQAVDAFNRVGIVFGGELEWVVRARLEQAHTLRDMGNRAQAIRLYESILQDYPGTQAALEAARELAALQRANPRR
ncbi:MAG: tetratricopeptide repeat protein [Bacteroidetes bacterium]|nr:tetratricopeptide repeat protein [Bacteroidota bacterium]